MMLQCYDPVVNVPKKRFRLNTHQQQTTNEGDGTIEMKKSGVKRGKSRNK